jgi:hypothetical protein
LPDARYRLRDVIAIPGASPASSAGWAPFSLDVGVIESNERANVELRGRQAGNLVSEVEARLGASALAPSAPALSIPQQPGRRSIVRGHIRDERRRAIDAARSRQRSNISYEWVLAKKGFHAFEMNADAADLDLPVLASYSVQQAVWPSGARGLRSKESTCAHANGCNALVRATSIGPTSQRHIWTCDNELADFARLRDAAILVDYREAVAREG